MAEVVRTNFAAIFSDFEIFLVIRAPIVATIFKSVPSSEKGFSFSKMLQTSSKSADKCRSSLLLN